MRAQPTVGSTIHSLGSLWASQKMASTLSSCLEVSAKCILFLSHMQNAVMMLIVAIERKQGF